MRTRVAVVCSVADQGVSALTNIAVLVVAARLSTAEGFSVFSLVYTVFAVLLGLSVSYVGQALVLERGEADAVRSACRSAVAFTAAASAAAGAVMAGTLALVPGETAAGLAVLGLVLPVLLTQDAVRYCFSTLRLPQHALTADLVRLAAVVPALAVQPQGTGPTRLIAVWGLSALPALLVGAALLRPRLRGVRGDPRRLLRRGHLGRRFVIEFAVGNASSQLAIVGLGLFANQLAVGALRGAVTLFGPLNVLFNAATSFGPPLLGRVRGTRGKIRVTAVLGGLLAAVAACWAGILLALPDRLGRELLGETWAASSALLPATGSQYAAMALGTCALLTLRVLRPRATLPLQVVFSLLSVAFLVAGYALGGVLGAAWGLCLGSALKAAGSWIRIAYVRREGTPRPAGGRRAAGSPGA
ncbi:MATE family efflux transporter [Streptomyces lycii]|uniref:Polysaccharide biosynthesis protein n=1 Tax=Streptomyces lycii TaxID=2654337 RepID=A0ABQ7FLS7_9ACTN|nr:hypothetical protein [Streptomyces lycii]KAF4409355.1 hypothetical protein GCU69_09415 [Streptomyces lycii]